MRSTMRNTRRGRNSRAHRRAGGDVGAALDLLERSRGTLLGAGRAASADERYIEAALGALRAAAALVAARAGVQGRGSVWESVVVQAPELSQWAAYWESRTRARREVEAGVRSPSWAEADRVLDAAETFLGLVQAALGLPITLPLGASAPLEDAASAAAPLAVGA